MVGARARGSFEDVVVRRAPGFTTASSIERERRERIHIEKKASARKRETSSRLSRKGSISLRIAGKCSKRVLVPGRDTEWQYRAFPSLLSKRSLARGRERGCSTTEIATRCRMTGHESQILVATFSLFSNTVQTDCPISTFNPDRKFQRITSWLETPEIFIAFSGSPVVTKPRAATEISSSIYAHPVYARLFA